MKLLLVSGMSGAGKSQTANVLEDIGFYCVDNIPPAIIPSFVELSARAETDIGRMAIVTDVRGGDMFTQIPSVLESLKNSDVDFKILFLDASNEVLIRRYKENRRRHPLCDKYGISIGDAIEKERKMLSFIRDKSDFVIDTSLVSIIQLKGELSEIFSDGNNVGLNIFCKSFGFKYGNDSEADIVFDVRCLPNPFYVEELKYKTGLDGDVKEYVLNGDEPKEFLKKITDFIDYSVPLYVREGKSQLVISFGCTGGKHRSVTFAELMTKHLSESGYSVTTVHRDIKK